MPKLSIITINYNNADELQRTIESIVNQSFKDYEYIIIDGGSTDGSVEILKYYSDKFSYWISEPDKGIFNAMNKGIDRASGEYILFMNSGDWLLHERIIEEAFGYGFSEDYIFGKANLVKHGKVVELDYVAPVTVPTLYSMLLYSLPHQASFIRRDLFNKHGKYDETLKIKGDWTFTVREVIINNCSVRKIPLTICNYDTSGISATHKELAEQEKKRILSELFPPRIMADYQTMLDFHTDYFRINWLRKHPFFHRLYLYVYKIGRKLEKRKII